MEEKEKIFNAIVTKENKDNILDHLMAGIKVLYEHDVKEISKNKKYHLEILYTFEEKE